MVWAWNLVCGGFVSFRNGRKILTYWLLVALIITHGSLSNVNIWGKFHFSRKDEKGRTGRYLAVCYCRKIETDFCFTFTKCENNLLICLRPFLLFFTLLNITSQKIVKYNQVPKWSCRKNKGKILPLTIWTEQNLRWIETRVTELVVKYPTPTFPKFLPPTFQIFWLRPFQNFRLRLLNIKGMKFGC